MGRPTMKESGKNQGRPTMKESGKKDDREKHGKKQIRCSGERLRGEPLKR
jgi:hypothetical protein